MTEVSTNVVIGSNTKVDRRVTGLVIMGHGDEGAFGDDGANQGTAGSTVRRAGCPSRPCGDIPGPVFEIRGARNVTFRDFSIVAENAPYDDVDAFDTCFSFTPKADPPMYAATQNIRILRVSCAHAANAGVLFTSKAGERNEQSDGNLIQDMLVRHVPICWDFANTNTQATLLLHSRCQSFGTYGLRVRDGRPQIVSIQLEGGIAKPKAAIRIEAGADGLFARNIDIETDHGDFIQAASGTTERFVGIFDGGEFNTGGRSGALQRCIDWPRGGVLQYSGIHCFAQDGATNRVEVRIDPPPQATLRLSYFAVRGQSRTSITGIGGSPAGGLIAPENLWDWGCRSGASAVFDAATSAWRCAP
jgi:hypothetical protein